MVRRLLVLLVPLALVGGACSSDGDEKAAAVTTTSTTSSTPSTIATSTTTTSPDGPATTAGAPTSTTTPAGDGIPLTGPNGSGSVAWTASAERSELCYRITVRGIGTPSEASLRHTAGESVLALQVPPPDGTVNTCSATDALTVEELHMRPGNFLVRVVGPKGTLQATLR